MLAMAEMGTRIQERNIGERTDDKGTGRSPTELRCRKICIQPEIDDNQENRDPVNGDQRATARGLTKGYSHQRIVNVQELRPQQWRW